MLTPQQISELTQDDLINIINERVIIFRELEDCIQEEEIDYATVASSNEYPEVNESILDGYLVVKTRGW